MRASVHIKIPKASKHESFVNLCDKYKIQARGIHGEHSETVGGVYDISNKRRLGLSELDCVMELHAGVKALLELEKSLETTTGKQEENSGTEELAEVEEAEEAEEEDPVDEEPDEEFSSS
ncbi:MAG: hypothetical protein MHM6MM_000633 [Cercozoa sp. M6MM]